MKRAFFGAVVVIVFIMGVSPCFAVERLVPDQYTTIQSAIDAAADGDIIVVAEGTYNEDINLGGKQIVVTSLNPDDPAVVNATTILGTGSGAAVTFSGTESSDCKLEGLRITGGTTGGVLGNDTGAEILKCLITNNNKDGGGGGIHRVNGTISHCTITGNTGVSGGGLAGCHGTIRNCIIANNHGTVSSAVNNCDGSIINCTIVNNTTSPEGVGVMSNCDGIILNSIVWNNDNDLLHNCTAQISYCCMPFEYDDAIITEDPQLTPDYHLMNTSPCINSGDPEFISDPGQTDMDGQNRISSWQIDIGADEFDGAVKPKAYAGVDQSYADVPAMVTLEGVAYTEPNTVVIYQWLQVSGPEVILSDDTASITTFSPAEPGTYIFELIINDSVEESDPDRVGVVVGNHSPIADAGKTVYGSTRAVFLDGSGSYDRDGYGDLTYQWQQISGEPLTIVNSQTSKPIVQGFVQQYNIQRFEFELVVSDGLLFSRADTVELVVLPTFKDDTVYQVNPPFDPSKPTMIGFGGGNCNTGGGLSFNSGYRANANVITVTSYKKPYTAYGDLIIDYLHRMAPDYDQPIQTAGFSTGNMPAVEVAIYMNSTYTDPRYAVNRVSFLDASCRSEAANVELFLNSAVEGEPCWIDNYYSTGWGRYLSNTVNILFRNPPASHGTPVNWFYDSIFFYDSWPFDIYNGGIVAGEFISVVGPAKNLDMVSANGYYFELVGDYNSGDPGYLDYYNKDTYPDRLLQPVRLSGPEDGTVIGAEGVVLTCLGCVQAVRYQLLFGSSPSRVDHIVSETTLPPRQTIKQFPFETTYWTVKAFDMHGNSIYAEPLTIRSDHPYEPVENIDLRKRYPYIQLAVDEAEDGEHIVVEPGIYRENLDMQGKSLILTSTDPDDTFVVETTVIQGDDLAPVINFAGTEGPESIIAGFTITGGNGGVAGNGAFVNVRKCVIKNNRRNDKGGGLHKVQGTIDACEIIGNEAEIGGGLNNCHGTIRNCLIVGNSAMVGGGIRNCDGEIVNCTIVSNTTTTSGEGVLADCDGSFTNCIIWDNSPGVFTAHTAQMLYTCWPESDGLNGNLNVDPLFILNGEYHLQPASSCIDSGTISPVGGLSEKDHDGNLRNLDGDGDLTAIPDMGAFEYDNQNAVMAVLPKDMEFYYSEEGAIPEAQELSVINCGGALLNWQISEDCNWLSVSPESGQSPGNVSISVQPQGLAKGTYRYVLVISSGDAFNSAQRCKVTLHVDNNTLHVPGEYGTVQYAIDSSQKGDIVTVSPGTYWEDINFGGKKVTLTSTDPDSPTVVAATIIRGSGLNSVVTFTGTENHKSIVSGLTITGGNGGIAGNGAYAIIRKCTITDNHKDGAGGGIHKVNGSIEDCEIVNNSAVGGGGLSGSHAVVRNCLIAANTAQFGAGFKNCDGNIVNCTIVSNSATSEGEGVLADCDGMFTNCIIWGNSSNIFSNHTAQMLYNCWPQGDAINGNLNVDPLFADFENGDYHLQSSAGRWDSENEIWVMDAVTSPCIDTGNPSCVLADEPASSQNVRINMGVYGGTGWTSRTPDGWALLTDLNNDRSIDDNDLMMFIQYWLSSGEFIPADLNCSGVVNLADFSIFSDNWF